MDTIEAANGECWRVKSLYDRPASFGEVRSMVTACSAALSSPVVATTQCITIRNICSYPNPAEMANRVTCGAAGVIPGIVAVMVTHGAASVMVAGNGCAALGALGTRNIVNADAIVSSCGGLDAILAVMRSHGRDSGVQYTACEALCRLAKAVSPAAKRVMLDSGILEVIDTVVKRNLAGDEYVVDMADQVLSALRA